MKRDEQFLREKRDALIQEHSGLATEKHTVWHARSRENTNPPCIQELADLRKIRLSSLRSQNHGTVLLVRAVERPLQLGNLFPVMNVIEDITHDVSHLEVFFSSTSPPLAILKQGNVVAIKEPLYVMNHGRKVIRVVHPSNIMVLKPEHEIFPKAFRELSISPEKTSLEWYSEGNNALNKGEYTESIDCYTNGLEKLGEDGHVSDLRQTLYCSRADAAMHAGLYELALDDAMLSLPVSDHKSSPVSSKALRLAGSAAYELCKFALAEELLQCRLLVCQTDSQGLKDLHRIKERIQEEKTGTYDFTAMLSQQNIADHATFINKTEIRHSKDHGRGLYAKDDINCGDLIFCEKAFSISHPPPMPPTDPYSIQNDNYYGGCGKGVTALWLQTVQKLFSNPSFAHQILTLYGGPSYSNETNTPIIDQQLTIDVHQILHIIDHNVYSFQAGHAKHPYGTTKHSSNPSRESVGLYQHASYMNHSCINNSSRSMTGDMMIVRANKYIAKDTEITTSYLFPGIGEPGRGAELLRIWGFECDCRLCFAEKACRVVDWKAIFDEVRLLGSLPKESYDAALLEKKIRDAEGLVDKFEVWYPGGLFEDGRGQLPRVTLRELQEILMVANARLGHHDISRQHALCFLRDSGYKLSSENSSLSMDCENGIPSKGVVDALFLLAKQENRSESAKQYLEVAKRMYLVVNGTDNAWEVAYGEL